MAEILRETCLLTKDQYGNYVIQHVLQHGQEAEREQVCVRQMSRLSSTWFSFQIV